MKVTSEFECGNGKGIAQLAPGRFRVVEVGEKAPYCKYFCVRVEGDPQGGVAELEVWPDPLLGEDGRTGFMSHYPSRLWFSETEMRLWLPVTNRWPGADWFAEEHIGTRVAVPPGKSLYVASNVAWPYSHMVRWAEALAAGGAECDVLGEAFEGRAIPRIHLPALGAGRLTVLVLAGQHPSEHCGPIAVRGIVDFLLSAHPEACAIRKCCDLWAIPMINVDGNVHGRNGWTVQDVNPFTDFSGASGGQAPVAVEDRLLWDWAAELEPHLCLNFHGYMGTRAFAEHPYDGCYVLKDPCAVYGPGRVELYRKVEHVLLWDTPALSATSDPGELDQSTLEWQLARRCGTVPAFYEINHGFTGVEGSRRRGADVLRAVVRAALEGG